MAERRYVSTGRDGRTETAAGEVVWAVPPTGAVAAGSPPHPPTEASEAVLELRSLDGLLDDLGERIFVAEPAADSATEPAADSATEPAADSATEPADEAPVEPTSEDPPLVRVRSARLIAETAWSEAAAAGFALACAEHAMGDQADVALPHGRTIGGVLEDLRQALDETGPPAASLGWLGRLATLHRLRRHGVAVGDLAMLAAKEDEKAGVDVLDDPAWTGLAAIEEAVLACAEAYRYLVNPRHVAKEEADYEERREHGGSRSPGVHVGETPWGFVALGTGRVPAHLPAARAAQHAAERSRQAVADKRGEQAAREERAWQVELLGSLLEGGTAGRS